MKFENKTSPIHHWLKLFNQTNIEFNNEYNFQICVHRRVWQTDVVSFGITIALITVYSIDEEAKLPALE